MIVNNGCHLAPLGGKNLPLNQDISTLTSYKRLKELVIEPRHILTVLRITHWIAKSSRLIPNGQPLKQSTPVVADYLLA